MTQATSMTPVRTGVFAKVFTWGKRQEWVREVTPRGFDELQAQQYIGERLNPELRYYNKEAGRYKSRYLRMRAITVIGGAVVPVLINLPDHPIKTFATTFLSLLVVLFVSLESVLHYREQWTNYRSTEQNLLSEYFSFTTRSGPYARLEGSDAFRLFVDRVEESLGAESAATLRVLTTVVDGKNLSASNGQADGRSLWDPRQPDGSVKLGAAQTETKTVIAVEASAPHLAEGKTIVEPSTATKLLAGTVGAEKATADFVPSATRDAAKPASSSVPAGKSEGDARPASSVAVAGNEGEKAAAGSAVAGTRKSEMAVPHADPPVI